MFWDLPYQDIGFSHKEWQLIPSGVKRIIRDYYLNGGSRPETIKYSFHETDFRVRIIENKYNLRKRPHVVVRPCDLCFA